MAHWRRALQELEGAYSDHTLRSYRSGFESFSAWCRRHRVSPLPAASETVAAYIRKEGIRLKPGTINARLCAIRKVHELCGFAEPTHHPDVDLAIRRIRRAQPSRPRQALGVTSELCDRLLAQCSDDLIGLRDKVLVSVGFDTLCRRSELVSISISDLTRSVEGRYSQLVRRAKNDPNGAGRIAHLSSRTSALVDRWLATIGKNAGPLLRPVYGSRASARNLQALTVSRVLKKLATKADVDVAKAELISGHSLRVGAAQQLALNGRGILQIMRAGGWRSTNVVARYVEHMDLDVWS
jgi:integrase/recombinase XerD